MTVSIDVLERVREYRLAARMAVRADEHRYQDRCLAGRSCGSRAGRAGSNRPDVERACDMGGVKALPRSGRRGALIPA